MLRKVRAQERILKRERAQERQIGGIERELKREVTREIERELKQEGLKRELKIALIQDLKGNP